MTARELIELAHVELGIVGDGYAMTDAQAKFGFTRFCQQLDSWAAEQLSLAVQNRLTYTIPSGENTATIGPATADITAQRPVWVAGVNYLVPSLSPAVETSLGRMDDDQYRVLSIKDLASSLPTLFYYQTSVTTSLGELFFWPTVTQDVDIAIYVPVAVGQPVALTSTVQGPPGYAEAFVYDLAYRLCTPYGRPTPPLLIQNRTEAMARMKRPNMQPGLMGVDPALTSGTSGGYNVLNDQTTTH